MKHLLFATFLASFGLSACAQSTQDTATEAKPAAAVGDAELTQALKRLNPQLQIDYIGAAPMAGFREVIVAGQVVYVSEDGHYLVQGNVLDLRTGQDATQSSAGMAQYRSGLLAKVPGAQRIVFAPPNPEYTVTVFTDVSCGYCRKLHEDIAEYNRQGIAVEYLAFPRMGPDSPDARTMASIWCSANPKQALTDAKSGKSVPSRSCKNPVAEQYALGTRVGVNGTPAIFSAGGVLVGGYLPAAQLRARLDALDK